MSSNPSIEQTSCSRLRLLPLATHVERMPHRCFLFGLVACLLSGAEVSLAGALGVAGLTRDAKVSVIERRTTDAEAARVYPCSRFVRTDREALAFLVNARRISESEEHYNYDVYHCVVSGVARTRAGVKLPFVIRLGGTGWLVLPGGERVLLGCQARCCKVARSVCG